MKVVSMQNLTIINHNGNHYRVNFAFMSKKDAYGLVKNAVIMAVIICGYYKDEFKKINSGDKEVDKKNSIHLKKLFY